jgi:ketosteroid isomerase-like protein
MSRERVETLRVIYDEWAKGNMTSGLDLYDADIVFTTPKLTPDGGRYVGLEEVQDWVRRWMRAWNGLTMTAEEFIDAGDTVVVAVRQRGVGKESGVPLENSYFQVWTFRGRAVIRVEETQDRAEALEAAGLSE